MASRKTHGLSATPGYTVWCNMMKRCFNPHIPMYSRYGGRGITVCERWRDVRNFIADMGQPPPGLTIERIDNHGDYKPENCRWATPAEQRRNTSRSLRMLEFRGEIRCVNDWSKITGINANAICARLDILGWSIEKALTAPKYTRSDRREIDG